MNAPMQLNGLVLLHSYQQRLFVYDSVRAVLSGQPQPQQPSGELAADITSLGEITANFDREAGLTDPQRTTALELVGKVRPECERRLFIAVGPEPADDAAHKLAVAATAVHGDLHINQGLQAIATTYDPQALPELTAQAEQISESVAAVNGFVESGAGGTAFAPAEVDVIDQWFTAISGDATIADVDTDLDLMRDLIGAD